MIKIPEFAESLKEVKSYLCGGGGGYMTICIEHLMNLRFSKKQK